MSYDTFLDIKNALRNELGLGQRGIVKPEELIDFCNRGVKEAAAEIMCVKPDYFKTKSISNIVNGTSTYAMPTDIFGAKIRLVERLDGDEWVPVKQIKLSNIRRVIYNDPFQYDLENTSGAGLQIVLYPTPQASITNGLRIWYLRRTKPVTVDSDAVDLPEFNEFVYQFCKLRVLEKLDRAMNGAAVDLAKQELEDLRKLMVRSLSNMVEDGDNEPSEDMEFYAESQA